MATLRPFVLAAALVVAFRSSSAQAPVTLTARQVGSDDVVLELGPMSLPANAGHDGLRQPPPLAVTFPSDGWIRGLRVELVDARGHAVPREVLHHVNVIVPDKRELFSPIMLRIGAAGTETGPLQLPRLLGYRVRAGDSVVVSAMMHNPTGKSYEGVRLRLHLPFVSTQSTIGAVGIVPFYLDVMPPAGRHAYDLPPGRSEKYWEGSPAIAGRILALGGHLHKYGVALTLEDRSANRVIWTARPTLDRDGAVVGMPTKILLWTLGERIYPDHVYRLTATYENPTGATIPDGAMGALGGVILPTRGITWPAIARNDSTYRVDVRVTYRLDSASAAGSMGGMHMGHNH